MSALGVIEELKERVEQLIGRCDQLNDSLDKSLRRESELKRESHSLRKRTKELETLLSKEQLKGGLGSVSRITNLMREIDRCIDLANAKDQ